jgi:alpha-L-fucosidase
MMQNKTLSALVVGASLWMQMVCTGRADNRTDRVLPETAAQHDNRMAWFRAARFGLFIHWGVYSVPGNQSAEKWHADHNYAEWFLHESKMPVSQYEKFTNDFDPVKFNADDWVRMAKDAGMKYIVITSKHHDGFGMWRSSLTDWCIKSTPFPRDPLKELAAACKKQGVKLCFYYSIMDWHSPLYSPRLPWNDVATNAPDFGAYDNYMKGQLRELLTGYGPLGLLWFDGQWEDTWTENRGIELYNYVRSLQPNIIVNNRVGKSRDEHGMNKADGESIGDYGTPEGEIPANGFGPGVDWESCMTMNDSWGVWKDDHNWKSATELIRNLIDCASKGGNYLLDVGPTDEGLFPPEAVARLKEIGDWMKVNSAAVFGTVASPFPKPLPWGRCTTKVSRNTTTLYLHIFDWPTGGKLLVPGLQNEIQEAYLLTNHQSVHFQRGENGLNLVLPLIPPDRNSSTVVLTFKGAPDVQPVQVSGQQMKILNPKPIL